MNLLNVRKGQFVYFKNRLHKVYSVTPFLKQAVHLVRLHDRAQQLATPKDIDLYKPKHLDSFIFRGEPFTLNKNARAKIGDYILVINPMPDPLDNHRLHAMEMVSSIEENGVISNKSNGIKHQEYWVMTRGLEAGATSIDLQDPHLAEDARDLLDERHDGPQTHVPKIGDIYQKNNSVPLLQSMVVAVKGQRIFLGGNLEVNVRVLTDSTKWSYMFNIKDA